MKSYRKLTEKCKEVGNPNSLTFIKIIEFPFS